MKNVKATLLCYEAVSDLRVNFFKSEMLGVRVKENLLLHYADILVCKVSSFPATYLGLPFSIRSSPKSMWNPMIERMEKKLSSWKANYVSFEGRITLINAALANLPIYYGIIQMHDYSYKSYGKAPT